MKTCLTQPLNNSQLPFDALGGVLTSTLSTALEAALAGQSALPDPATGLVHFMVTLSVSLSNPYPVTVDNTGKLVINLQAGFEAGAL